MPDWLIRGAAHIWRPYTQHALAEPALPVVSTEGCRIILADGRELIDGIASWWTACHGYNHPQIRAAVSAQLARMPHVMFGGLAHEPGYGLAARLAALVPALPHVFFSDSGSVGVEVAMKMALQMWLNRGETGRVKFLSFLGGYHGDTLGAMSVCDPEEGMHGLFGPALAAQHVVALPREAASEAALDDVLARHGREIAGIIVEPLVQGAGGMVFHEPAVLRRIRAAADAHGVPLIFDEVFTGFGRTGHFFVGPELGVLPDIMVVSKALTGGTMGLAATLASPAIFAAFHQDRAEAALMHGPTFMANPLACAAANASLDIFAATDWRAAVARIAAGLRTGLAPLGGHEGVRDVRVLGAIGVVELAGRPDLAALKREFLARGVWVRPFRSVVYLTPAFTIDPESLAKLTGAVVDVVRDYGKKRLF